MDYPAGSMADNESLIFFITGDNGKDPRLPMSDVTVYIEHRRTRKVVDEFDGSSVDKELKLFLARYRQSPTKPHWRSQES